MYENNFPALNNHLREVGPIFDDFCARNGFMQVDPKSLGRYPRIRIERKGITRIWYDLWMEFDENGRRFEQFQCDLPYELSAGAYIDVQSEGKGGVRYQKCFQCFSGKPFNQVSAVLLGEMEKHLSTLEKWDLFYLKANGDKVQIG